jgi:hypothetical protein
LVSCLFPSFAVIAGHSKWKASLYKKKDHMEK